MKLVDLSREFQAISMGTGGFMSQSKVMRAVFGAGLFVGSGIQALLTNDHFRITLNTINFHGTRVPAVGAQRVFL